MYIDLIEAKISDIVTERERRKCKMFQQVYLKGNKKRMVKSHIIEAAIAITIFHFRRIKLKKC